jgi:molecular chaperone GrpE
VTEEQTRIEDEPRAESMRDDESENELQSPDEALTVEAVEGEIVEEAPQERAEAVSEALEEEEVDELQALREQLEAVQAQADEYLDDLRRERAAFQNYKKRQENERAGLWQSAVSSFLVQILPILDDLERALDAVPEDQADQAWVEGVLLIQRKLQTTLEGTGVVPIEAEPGQSFDPFVHEAVSYEENEDYGEGEIIAVVQNGYQLGERTLRPAMVRVAK